MIEGFRFARRHAWLWATLLASMIALLATWGPIEVLVPFIVRNELGGGAQELGLVFAAGGLGAILASVALARRGLPARTMTFLYLAWTGAGAAVVGYGLATTVWHAGIAGFINGALVAAGLIVWATLLQTLVPPELRGRVMSVDWLVSIGLVPLSFALTDRVRGARRAMDEVPLPQRALLALDDQERLAGEDQEILLVGLPVIHRHRLSRLEHEEVDAELRKLRVALEPAHGSAWAAVEPPRVARVQHEPAFALRHEPVLRLLERRLRNHGRTLTQTCERLARFVWALRRGTPAATRFFDGILGCVLSGKERLCRSSLPASSFGLSARASSRQARRYAGCKKLRRRLASTSYVAL